MCLMTATILAGTAAVLAPVLLPVAGAIVGTVSAIQNAENQKAQAEYQAQIAAQNARLAQQHAEQIEIQGNQKRAALLREHQQKIGESRGAYAANGVVLGSGTPVDYEADLANAYDLDLKNLNYDLASEAWQSRVQGVSYRNQNNLYKTQASLFGKQKSVALANGAVDVAGKTSNGALSIAKLATGLLG